MNRFRCAIAMVLITFSALNAETKLQSVRVFSDGYANFTWSWDPEQSKSFSFYAKTSSHLDAVAASLRVDDLATGPWQVYYQVDPKPENLPNPPVSGTQNQTMLQFLISLRGQEVVIEVNGTQVGKGGLLEVEKSPDATGDHPNLGSFFVTIIDGMSAKRIQLGSAGFSVKPTNQMIINDLNDGLQKLAIANTSQQRLLSIVLNSASQTPKNIKVSYKDLSVACKLESRVTVASMTGNEQADIHEVLIAQLSNLSPVDWPADTSIEFVEAAHDSTDDKLKDAHRYKVEQFLGLNRMMVGRIGVVRIDKEISEAAVKAPVKGRKLFIFDPKAPIRWREGVEIPESITIVDKELVLRSGNYSTMKARIYDSDLKKKEGEVLVGPPSGFGAEEVFILKSITGGKLKYARGFESTKPERGFAVSSDFTVTAGKQRILIESNAAEEISLRTPDFKMLERMAGSKLVGSELVGEIKAYVDAQLKLRNLSARPAKFTAREAEVRECRTTIERFFDQFE